MTNNMKAKSLENLILSIIKFIDPKAKVEIEVATPTTPERSDGGRGETIKVNIVSEDSGLLIGRFGQTLDSVQYIIRLMINMAMGEQTSSTVDVAGYKAGKEKELVELALSVAENVKNSNYPQSLRPMNAYERRIVHSALTGFEGIETASVGEEPTRYIEIKPKG